MIPPQTLVVSDEEAGVLREALDLFVADFESGDEAADNRSRRIAEELCRRLPIACAPLSRAA